MKNYLYNLATDNYRGFWASLAKFILLLASFIYGAVVRCLMLFYSLEPARLSCKVVSVGNITVGGTGKTSLVEVVARFLRSKGRKVAVLSRGYKKLSQEMGDEPAMLLMNLEDVPVIVDPNRIRGAKRAIKEYGADTVLLDDGLQQWRMKKDLEIVTINASEGFGNRHMLPRGLLRQPLSSLRQADIFVLTKTNLVNSIDGLRASLNSINSKAAIIESKHEALGFYNINSTDKLLGLDHLKGKKAAIFSGIGDPDSFADLVISLGIDISLDVRFGDHYNYSDEDLAGICAEAKAQGSNILITTQKDASRLSEDKLHIFKGCQLLVLRIGLKITKNEKQFTDRLLSLYSL